MSQPEELFSAHLEVSLGRIAESMNELGVSDLVLGSGRGFVHFQDDQEAPFRVDPCFAWLCPQCGPGHLLHIVPGKKPKLLRVEPKTFWVEQAAAPDSWWAESFEIETVETAGDAWRKLALGQRSEFVGRDTRFAEADGVSCNRELVVNGINWWRSIKTDYEIACISEANAVAAKGHIAARLAFMRGASEFESMMAFLTAVGQCEHELPFAPIFASNEKAAILHYEKRRHVRGQSLLLVDAGASVNGYSSDISRTCVLPICHSVMRHLALALNLLQQEICGWAVVGKTPAALQFEAFKAIAKLLEQAELLKLNGDYEMAVREGIMQVFLPHGLGHPLGVVTHDVGYQQANRLGVATQPMEGMPRWRSTRPFEEGTVLTVEPGIYFNSMLIEKARAGKHAERYDFSLMDTLVRFGGIRIEDNVVVTKDGPRNLTRPVLPE